MPLYVLVVCEESGTVRDAFIRGGHFAVSCDLSPTRSPGPHYQGDLFDIIGGDWDMVIGHPPCTYLSSSGLHWNRNPQSVRYGGKQTADALDFVRRLWAASRHIRRRCWENPIGCIGTQLRKATQIIQPYDFGDDASKATCLWLDDLPSLVPTKRIVGRRVMHNGKLVERWSNQTDSGQNRLGPSVYRARIRSETYRGIADAMVAQWGNL